MLSQLCRTSVRGALGMQHDGPVECSGSLHAGRGNVGSCGECRVGTGAAAEASASGASDATARPEASEASIDGSGGDAAAAATPATAACVEVAAPHPLAGTVFFDEFKETGAAVPVHAVAVAGLCAPGNGRPMSALLCGACLATAELPARARGLGAGADSNARPSAHLLDPLMRAVWSTAAMTPVLDECSGSSGRGLERCGQLNHPLTASEWWPS